MSEFILRRGGSANASAARVALIAASLVFIGLLVQLAVTTTRSVDPHALVRRQIIYASLAGLVGLAAYGFGYRRAVAWSRPLLIGTWVLLGFLLIPGGAHIGGGSARWIELGIFGHLQPSEVAKVVLILFFSGFAIRKGRELANFRAGFLPAMSYLGITAGLVALEPDLGQTVFLAALSAAVLMINGLKVRHFLPVFALGVPVLFVAMSEKWAYIGKRVEGFLAGSHYQVEQGLHFFASGGVAGQQLGDGRAHLFVPEIRNDFALVAIGEHSGLIGCVIVVALFAALLHQGVRLALLARDRLGFSVAFGLALMIALQAAVNIAVVTSLIPPKGISLPFISFGGSSMLVNAVAIGLLASVADDARSPEEAMA
ncbi:MAG: FtsW/RodA/SpoVE family cell cycle protein [Planctomycetota bacterium]|nr:FtsW/RodA/SpoVE family cell cycle protein [Planctomycetota bacterium]